MQRIKDFFYTFLSFFGYSYYPTLGGVPRSSKWSKVRKEFLKENPVCTACGSNKNLIVHHKFPYHLFPEKELQKENLISHFIIHIKKLESKNFAVFQNVVKTVLLQKDYVQNIIKGIWQKREDTGNKNKTMKREKHLGFIEPKVDKRDYYLGGGNLPRVILEPLGDWSDALPVNELQNIRNIETYNCTAFGATNQIEMYEYKAFGERNNYSDRFVGICAGTKAPGNDPTTVYEAIRKYGLIPEEMLPFSDDIKTIDDYFSFKGADMEACYRKGREWLATHEFLHQWVFDRNAPLEEKMNNMKIALKYSPLAIGVWAWTLNDQGCYVREGIDVHWTVCHCATNLEYIFDSYSPFLKLLVPDFNFYYAKRISIEKKDPIAENQKAYAFLSELLDLAKTICLKMLQQLKLMPKTPEITPITPIEKPKNAIRRTLSEIAIEYIGKDASPANLAPSEVSCAEAVSNIINQYDSSFPKGITYTPDLVKELDKSKLFERTLTPSKDCVIISPTERTNIGHAGIFITDSRIVSNDSKSGLMADNYSYNNWIKYFKTGKGLRILIFKLI